MSTTALLIVLAVLAIIVVLIVVDRRSGRPRRAVAPECTLETAWEHYVSHPEQGTERDRLALATLAGSRGAPPPEVESALSEAIERALAAPEPIPVLRQAIMDATDRFVMEEILYQPGPPADGAAAGGTAAPPGATAALEAGVLRRFAGLRFADWAEEDWYTHYLKVARMNAENVATMVEKTVSGGEARLETALHQRLSGGMRQARAALLGFPPQTAVTAGTKLVGPEPTPARRVPSQRQIELLTGLLGDRFERLISGQVYQTMAAGSTVPPAIAIQVDTALLYATLGEHFREPDEPWRRIVGETLGSQGDDQRDALHENAREVLRRCAAERSRGHFDAALTAACELAATGAGSPGQRDPAKLSTAMRDDASFLVASIHDIAGQEE